MGGTQTGLDVTCGVGQQYTGSAGHQRITNGAIAIGLRCRQWAQQAHIQPGVFCRFLRVGIADDIIGTKQEPFAE